MITRRQIIDHLGGRCARCGETDITILTVDHRYGGGWKDRRLYGGNVQGFYKAILADRSGRFQCLCHNCQWRKRVLLGEDGSKNRLFALPSERRVNRLLARIRKRLEQLIC